MTSLQDIQDRVARLEGVRQKYLQDKADLTTKIGLLEHQQEVLAKSSEALKAILQTLVEDEREGVQNLITEGLRAIFDDQRLSFKIISSIKRGRVNIDFQVVDEDTGITGDVVDSFGGGVVNIVSLLFRFITAMKLGLYPLLVLDESLSNVSEEYIENTGKFLKSLCSKTKFDVLLVTHQPRFIEHADLAYVGELTDHGLVLKEIDDEKRS